MTNFVPHHTFAPGRTGDVRHRLQVQEVVEDLRSNKTFVRNYCYERTYDGNTGQVVDATARFNCNVPANRQIASIDCQEPMEVDITPQEINTTEIVAYSTPATKYWYLNKWLLLGGVLACFLFAVVSFLQPKITQIDLTAELRHELIGQDEAVRLLGNALDRKVQFVALVGGSGVGKTLAVNVVKRHCNYYELRHEDVERTLKSMLYNKVVIIEDLPKDRLRVVLELATTLSKGTVVLVVLNVQEAGNDGFWGKIDEGIIAKLRSEIEKLDTFELVEFEPISVETADLWLQRELLRRDGQLTQYALLSESLIDKDNLKYKGLKGISAKLTLALQRALTDY